MSGTLAEYSESRMFTAGSPLELPSYKCFPRTNPFNLHDLSGESAAAHNTDDEKGSEGLKNLLKVTQTSE